MLTLLGPMLAVIVLAQAPNDLTVAGEVVDDTGKPLADVAVVYYAAPVVSGNEDQAEAQTRTDAGGQFRMKIPAYRRTDIAGMNFLAYRRGLAITAKSIYPRPYRLVLRKPEPQTIQIEGPDGRPIAGARIAPKILHVFNGYDADIPASLADPLAVTTGPEGRASLEYLAARDQLVAVRVSADLIGTQDILLVERPGRSSVEPVIKIKLKRTGHACGSNRGWSAKARLRSSGRDLVEGRRDAAAAEFGRIARRPALDDGGRTLSDPGQPPGRLDVSGGRSSTRQGSDPLRLDHNRRDAQDSPSHALAVVTDRQRTGDRSTGEASRECRSLPVRRRARANLDPERRRRPVCAPRLSRRPGLRLRTRRGVPIPRAVDSRGRA